MTSSIRGLGMTVAVSLNGRLHTCIRRYQSIYPRMRVSNLYLEDEVKETVLAICLMRRPLSAFKNVQWNDEPAIASSSGTIFMALGILTPMNQDYTPVEQGSSWVLQDSAPAPQGSSSMPQRIWRALQSLAPAKQNSWRAKQSVWQTKQSIWRALQSLAPAKQNSWRAKQSVSHIVSGENLVHLGDQSVLIWR